MHQIKIVATEKMKDFGQGNSHFTLDNFGLCESWYISDRYDAWGTPLLARTCGRQVFNRNFDVYLTALLRVHFSFGASVARYCGVEYGEKNKAKRCSFTR